MDNGRLNQFLEFLKESNAHVVHEDDKPIIEFEDEGDLNFFEHAIKPSDPWFEKQGSRLKKK